MSEDLSPDRKRLLYRAKYRGFKEADMVVGRFAEAHIASMTDTEVEEFRRLLDVPDHTLYAWVVGREAVPENYLGPVLAKMQNFDVAATIA